MAARVAVVTPGGGGGARLGGRVRKQFIRLRRIPIVTMTVGHFTRHPAVTAIVVAAPEPHVERTRRALAPVARRAPLTVVPGGRTRQDSVWLALQAVPDDAEIVVVHDAVRPLITRRLIDAVVSAGAASGAAICALPITETVKRVRDDIVDATLDRSGLWAVQTPQAFRADLLRESHAIGEALLGALALGDLGRHFPDTDARYRGISSLRLLRSVVELVTARGGRLVNVDATVLAQAPRLAPLLPEMAKRLADVLGLEIDRVSVKAKSPEGLGLLGRQEGMGGMGVGSVDVTG